MIVMSNHLIGKMPIPKGAIIRVNLAWIKDIETARDIVKNSKRAIYLDYPSGRTKPPVPTIELVDALMLSCHKNVDYFAISNAEDIELLQYLQLETTATLVPKIETVTGVKRLGKMKKIGITHFMLDADDLYNDTGRNNKLWNKLVTRVKKQCDEDGITLFTLGGVIFI